MPATASVRVESAWIVRPAGDAPAAIYLTVVNDAAVADTLLGIGGDVARTITLHEPVRMAAVNAFPVAAHGTLYLAPGGAHAMAEGLYRRLQRGGRIVLTVRFSTAGAVRTAARVIDYADVDSAVLRRRQR